MWTPRRSALGRAHPLDLGRPRSSQVWVGSPGRPHLSVRAARRRPVAGPDRGASAGSAQVRAPCCPGRPAPTGSAHVASASLAESASICGVVAVVRVLVVGHDRGKQRTSVRLPARCQAMVAAAVAPSPTAAAADRGDHHAPPTGDARSTGTTVASAASGHRSVGCGVVGASASPRPSPRAAAPAAARGCARDARSGQRPQQAVDVLVVVGHRHAPPSVPVSGAPVRRAAVELVEELAQPRPGPAQSRAHRSRRHCRAPSRPRRASDPRPRTAAAGPGRRRPGSPAPAAAGRARAGCPAVRRRRPRSPARSAAVPGVDRNAW